MLLHERVRRVRLEHVPEEEYLSRRARSSSPSVTQSPSHHSNLPA